MATEKQLAALKKARAARKTKATKTYKKSNTTSSKKVYKAALGAITMEKAKEILGAVMRDVNSIHGELTRGYQDGKKLSEIYTLGELMQTIEGLKMRINGIYFSL